MSDVPFYARDLSIEARRFLYSCAFWAVAADEELTGAEQKWLIDQFGEDGATSSLEEFVSLESDAFFAAFDASVKDMSDQDKAIVYPDLRSWLESCAGSEERTLKAEKEIIEKIAGRISLDAEIRRLKLSDGKAESVSPVYEAEGVRELTGHQAAVNCLAYHPEGSLLVSGADDGSLKLWDPDEGREITDFKSHEMGVTDVCFMPCGKRVLSADRLGVLRMSRVENGELLWENKLPGFGGITCLDVSSGSGHILSSSDIGLIVLHSAGNGARDAVLGERRRGAISGVAFSPDSLTIISGGDDGLVRIYRLSDLSEIKVMSGHDSGVMGVAFSPDGKFAASASRDNTVIIWDIGTGREKHVLKGHTFSVYSVDFSPDGKFVVSAGWDHTFKVWDVASGVMVLNVESSNGGFSAAVFSPDGKNIAAGCDDKSIYLAALE